MCRRGLGRLHLDRSHTIESLVAGDLKQEAEVEVVLGRKEDVMKAEVHGEEEADLVMNHDKSLD